MHNRQNQIDASHELQRRLLLWSEIICFLLSFVLIGYLVLVLFAATIYDHKSEIQIFPPRPATAPVSSRESRLLSPSANEGDILGRLRIPSLRLSVPILEGTSAQTLRLGVAHLPDTPALGSQGNTVVIGHRDTFFRPLQLIQAGDQVHIDTRAGAFVYKIQWIAIVSPDDEAMVQPSDEANLTLITCYPFHYIGAAPERFVVRGRLMNGAGLSHIN